MVSPTLTRPGSFKPVATQPVSPEEIFSELTKAGLKNPSSKDLHLVD